MADLNNLFNFLSLFGGSSASENLQNMDREAGIGNNDGVTIKAEFARAVNNNWDCITANGWNGEISKKEDLINKWWKSIDLDRSNKRIAGTSMNEVNALSQKELDIIDSKSNGFDWISAMNGIIKPQGGGTTPGVTPGSDDSDLFNKARNHYMDNDYSEIKKLLSNDPELFNKITGSDVNKAKLDPIISHSVQYVLNDIKKIDYAEMDKLILEGIYKTEFAEVTNNNKTGGAEQTDGNKSVGGGDDNEATRKELIDRVNELVKEINDTNDKVFIDEIMDDYGEDINNKDKLTVEELKNLIKSIEEAFEAYKTEKAKITTPTGEDDEEAKRQELINRVEKLMEVINNTNDNNFINSIKNVYDKNLDDISTMSVQKLKNLMRKIQERVKEYVYSINYKPSYTTDDSDKKKIINEISNLTEAIIKSENQELIEHFFAELLTDILGDMSSYTNDKLKDLYNKMQDIYREYNK